MAWKFESGISLSVQICDRLRRDILAGVYGMGEQFPTVRQLATEAAVNPNTMQKAMSMLENEGLIVTDGTQGRHVTTDPEIIGSARERETAALVDKIRKESEALGMTREEIIESIRKGWRTNE